ncbi:MAG: hypothetical protein IJ026_04630 [Candidatus Methanomethylophilaceae archaeon]|nr:hypothetical protein [Candidatus Methanomethylophilaceae archaeon]
MESMGSKVTAALAVVAVILSAVALFEVATGDEDNRAAMHFGMGDRTDAEITEIESFVSDLVTTGYGQGYTVYRASGAAVVDGEVIRDGTTLVFIVNGIDSDTAMEMADTVVERFGVVAMVEMGSSSMDLLLP